MEEDHLKIARISQIITPFQFILYDLATNQPIKIEIKPTTNQAYYHLLSNIYQDQFRYKLSTKKSTVVQEQFKKGYLYIRQASEDKQQWINITDLYQKEQQQVQYMIEEIQDKNISCYVLKVECLKLQLFQLKTTHIISFYFSDLKLLKIGNLNPKEIWEKSHLYFKKELQGCFVQLQIAGSEKYKEQINIYGEIYKRKYLKQTNTVDKLQPEEPIQQNIKQRLIIDGYAEASKNADKYLNQEQIQNYQFFAEKAKLEKRGLWETEKNIVKATSQALEFKYKQWQEWLKEGKNISSIKYEEEELKNILEELLKQCGSSSKINKHENSNVRAEYPKIKILIQVMMLLLENRVSSKNGSIFEEMAKKAIQIFDNLQNIIYSNLDNIDYLKIICKILIFLQFYLEETQKYQEKVNTQKQPHKVNTQKQSHKPKNHLFLVQSSQTILSTELERVIKFIFKLSFLGNTTFHDKLFNKNKQYNYENFAFEDPTYLNGGFSSMSECSQNDTDEDSSSSKVNKKQKKINNAYMKIRINSSKLISLIMKRYPEIVQNHWELCVKPNILTDQFITYLHKLKLTTQSPVVEEATKKEMVNLMRTNFGDHSLILLTIFEKNQKIKLNTLECLLNMLQNFQSKKLINNIETLYIQKLLKETKSSFVPKSFIIFNGMRNILYLLLFALYYQKNIQNIEIIFKTLSEVCNNCTLINKISFSNGIGLLVSGYILPVLQFSWHILELQKLKTLCINFMAILVTNSHNPQGGNQNNKWQELEQRYFIVDNIQMNINMQLMDILEHQFQHKKNHIRQTHRHQQIIHQQNKHQQSKHQQNEQNQILLIEDKLIDSILEYFIKLSKKYYTSIFFSIQDNPKEEIYSKSSIWKHCAKIFCGYEAVEGMKIGQQRVNLLASVNKQSRDIVIVEKYSEFIEELFKCHFDEQKNKDEELQNECIDLIEKQSPIEKAQKMTDVELAHFLEHFLCLYSKNLTVNNYIHLIGILTYIRYEAWQSPSHANLIVFIDNLFLSMAQHYVEEKDQQQFHKYQHQTIAYRSVFPSIENLKNNALIRINLIKMLGYLSFCPNFHCEFYVKYSLKILLNYSKMYKSLNSIVKTTWSLSNCAKITNFSRYLHDQEIKVYLEYLMQYSESDKEKIASNCTRGIGFFIKEISLNYQGKLINLEDCKQVIIKNLNHQIVKVRTNSTKTLLNIHQFIEEKYILIQIMPFLEQNILKTNYNLQTQTLDLIIKIKKIGYTNEQNLRRLFVLYLKVLKNLLNQINLEYEFKEIKLIKNLRINILNEIFARKLLQKDEDIHEKVLKGIMIQHESMGKDLLQSVETFLMIDCRNEAYREDKKQKEIAIDMVAEQKDERIMHQRSDEAEKLIFNLKKMEKYDEEKQIQTESLKNGLTFQTTQENINLIYKIQSFIARNDQKIDSLWLELLKIKVEGKGRVIVEQLSIQTQ